MCIRFCFGRWGRGRRASGVRRRAVHHGGTETRRETGIWVYASRLKVQHQETTVD